MEIELRMSWRRVFAKTLHCAVIGWTLFWAAAVIGGLLTEDLSRGPAQVGAAIGLIMTAVLWGVPALIAELVALILSRAARGLGTSPALKRREWQWAVAVSAPLQVLLLVVLVATGAFEGRDPVRDVVAETAKDVLERRPGDTRIILPAEVRAVGAEVTVKNAGETDWRAVQLYLQSNGLVFTRVVELIPAGETVRFPVTEFKDFHYRTFDLAAGTIERFYFEALVGSGGGIHDGIIR